MGTSHEKMEFFDVLNDMRKSKYFSWRIRYDSSDHYYLPTHIWGELRNRYNAS